MISLDVISIQAFLDGLKTTDHLLEAGASHADQRHFDREILVDARLAPDMFELRKHVQMACYNAREWVARVTTGSSEKPALIADDFAALKRRIAETIGSLESLPKNALKDAAERDVEIPVSDGMVIAMNGLELLRDWSLPQFYFHVTTVYAILRHNGVAIGIQDFGQSAVGRHIRMRH